MYRDIEPGLKKKGKQDAPRLINTKNLLTQKNLSVLSLLQNHAIFAFAFRKRENKCKPFILAFFYR